MEEENTTIKVEVEINTGPVGTSAETNDEIPPEPNWFKSTLQDLPDRWNNWTRPAFIKLRDIMDIIKDFFRKLKDRFVRQFNQLRARIKEDFEDLKKEYTREKIKARIKNARSNLRQEFELAQSFLLPYLMLVLDKFYDLRDNYKIKLVPLSFEKRLFFLMLQWAYIIYSIYSLLTHKECEHKFWIILRPMVYGVFPVAVMLLVIRTVLLRIPRSEEEVPAIKAEIETKKPSPSPSSASPTSVKGKSSRNSKRRKSRSSSRRRPRKRSVKKTEPQGPTETETVTKVQVEITQEEVKVRPEDQVAEVEVCGSHQTRVVNIHEDGSVSRQTSGRSRPQVKGEMGVTDVDVHLHMPGVEPEDTGTVQSEGANCQTQVKTEEGGGPADVDIHFDFPPPSSADSAHESD